MTDAAPTDVFHAHLDACAWCRENPFFLCGVGNRLVREAAEALVGRPVQTVEELAAKLERE